MRSSTGCDSKTMISTGRYRRSSRCPHTSPPWSTHHKKRYRVENWNKYERGLRSRGDVTVRLSDDAVDAWTPKHDGRRGGRRLYSDLAIETALTLRLVLGLALRQTEGFVASLLRLMGLALPSPDHTTLSRRSRQLRKRPLPRRSPSPLELVVDSSRLKVVGQGQWAAAKHGARSRRGWRKLHVGVDGKRFIVAHRLTDSSTEDASVVPALLDRVDGSIERFTADGAYDTWRVRETLASRGARVVVPPAKTAELSSRQTTAGRERDAAIEAIRAFGRRRWKKDAGYHAQASAENTFFERRDKPAWWSG